MADTPKLSMPEISASQASKYLTHNGALRILDASVQGVIIDRDLTAPPGSPSDGDTYIVGTTATGDWATHEDEIAYYKSSAWIFLTPAEGWVYYAQDENELLIYQGSAWDTLAAVLGLDGHDVGGSKEGLPGVSEVLLRYVFTRSVTFADDFAGSHGVVGTGPSDSAGADFDVQQDGVSVGTMSFASAATTATFISDSGGVSFIAGEVLTIVAPGSQDPALADIGFMLAGIKT